MPLPSLPVFPQPRSSTLLEGRISFVHGLQPPALIPPSLASSAYPFGCDAIFRDEPNALPLKVESLTDSAPPGSFELEATPAGIRIHSADRTGWAYAVFSLESLVGARWEGRAFRITDRPLFATRGIMLDISRTRVPRLQSLLDRIAVFARLRINQLQLYIENTFAFSNHREVWADASPLTSEDLLQIRHCCEAFGIEFVPNLNSFGHMERWLKHSRYRGLAEHPGPVTSPGGTHHPNGTTFKPEQASADFMEDLYREFLPSFTSPLFHIGCDETWELGQGWSAPQVREEGLAAVYCKHLERLFQKVRAFDRTPMFWADIILNHPGAEQSVSRDSIPVLWGYEADHPFASQCRTLREAGFRFLVAPGTSSWLSLGTRAANARGNCSAAASQARAFGADGLLLTDWGDRGHHQPWIVSWVPVFQFAAAAWSGSLPADRELVSNLDRVLHWNPSDRLSQALLELGTLDQEIQYTRQNWSPLYELLVADPDSLRNLRENITTGELQNTRDRIDAIRNRVTASGAEADPIHLTLGFLDYAVDRGLNRLDSSRLRELLREYRRLRLLESRPGGLRESLAWFPVAG